MCGVAASTKKEESLPFKVGDYVVHRERTHHHGVIDSITEDPEGNLLVRAYPLKGTGGLLHHFRNDCVKKLVKVGFPKYRVGEWFRGQISGVRHVVKEIFRYNFQYNTWEYATNMAPRGCPIRECNVAQCESPELKSPDPSPVKADTYIYDGKKISESDFAVVFASSRTLIEKEQGKKNKYRDADIKDLDIKKI